MTTPRWVPVGGVVVFNCDQGEVGEILGQNGVAADCRRAE